MRPRAAESLRHPTTGPVVTSHRRPGTSARPRRPAESCRQRTAEQSRQRLATMALSVLSTAIFSAAALLRRPEWRRHCITSPGHCRSFDRPYSSLFLVTCAVDCLAVVNLRPMTHCSEIDAENTASGSDANFCCQFHYSAPYTCIRKYAEIGLLLYGVGFIFWNVTYECKRKRCYNQSVMYE